MKAQNNVNVNTTISHVMMSNTEATTYVAILTSATINKKSKQLNKESMA